MSIFKKTATTTSNRSALRMLTTNEVTAIGGGKQMVCPPGTKYYAGQCIKDKK